MSAISWFRFLNTPAELWTRIMARLVGARVEFSATTAGQVRFEMAINIERTKLLLRINNEAMVLDKTEATHLAETLAAVVVELNDPAAPLITEPKL